MGPLPCQVEASKSAVCYVRNTSTLAVRSAHKGDPLQRIEEGYESAASLPFRLAEEFIEANWDRPITIEALAAATNVSARKRA